MWQRGRAGRQAGSLAQAFCVAAGRRLLGLVTRPSLPSSLPPAHPTTALHCAALPTFLRGPRLKDGVGVVPPQGHLPPLLHQAADLHLALRIQFHRGACRQQGSGSRGQEQAAGQAKQQQPWGRGRAWGKVGHVRRHRNWICLLPAAGQQPASRLVGQARQADRQAPT